MAAGQGFKDFVTGEVLTANDVDGYLMQGVWVFASAAARTAAVTSPQEGNMSYLKDTNSTEYYSGSAWVAIGGGGSSPLTTKGDLYTYSTTDARLGVGTNDYVLTAASGETTGLKWAAPAAASGPAFRATKSSSQTGVADNTYTKVTFNTETFDTDNCFDNTTNYRFTPTKSGYYSLQVDVTIASSTGTSFCELFYYFNGSSLTPGVRLMTTTGGQANPAPSMLYYFNGSSDYMEIYARIEDAGGGRAFQAGYFSGVWIRS